MTNAPPSHDALKSIAHVDRPDISPRNAMGGARLSKDGLHLGHYLGCALPLAKIECGQKFFVIRDVDRSNDAFKGGAHQEILEFTKDVVAIDASRRIGVVLQSHLLECAPMFWRFLLSLVSTRHLVNAHPRRRDIRAGELPDSTVANLLFPIDSIHSYYCLGASRVCMNDDNIRFVELGSRYARRLAKAKWGDLISEPMLVMGPAPRLIGCDHLKISHSSGNAYYLRRGPSGIANYMFHLFNKSSFFKRFPVDHEAYRKSPMSYSFPETFAPFSHLCLFFGQQKARELWGDMTINRFEATVDSLTSAGERLLREFAERRNVLSDADAALALRETKEKLEPRLAEFEQRVDGIS